MEAALHHSLAAPLLFLQAHRAPEIKETRLVKEINETRLGKETRPAERGKYHITAISGRRAPSASWTRATGTLQANTM